MGGRSSSVRRARRQAADPLEGFIVTWDVDTRDASLCAQVRRFVYGYATEARYRRYRHPGFVEREGVRYLGQSVLFVTPPRLREIRDFFHARVVSHAVFTAAIGGPFTC